MGLNPPEQLPREETRMATPWRPRAPRECRAGTPAPGGPMRGLLSCSQGLSPPGCPLSRTAGAAGRSGVPEGSPPPLRGASGRCVPSLHGHQLVGVSSRPRDVRAEAELRVVWRELLQQAGGCTSWQEAEAPARLRGLAGEPRGPGNAVGQVSHSCHIPKWAQDGRCGRGSGADMVAPSVCLAACLSSLLLPGYLPNPAPALPPDPSPSLSRAGNWSSFTQCPGTTPVNPFPHSTYS